MKLAVLVPLLILLSASHVMAQRGGCQGGRMAPTGTITSLGSFVPMTSMATSTPFNSYSSMEQQLYMQHATARQQAQQAAMQQSSQEEKALSEAVEKTKSQKLKVRRERLEAERARRLAASQKLAAQRNAQR